MSGPVEKISDFPLAVAIWLNEGDSGKYYSVSCKRVYIDGVDDNGKKIYKRSDSLGKKDIPTMMKLMDLAHTHIMRLEAKDRE